MTLTYGFYDSINGDRTYDAKDLSQLFDGIINDGIFMSIGSYFLVTPGTGLQVVVGTGRAWFNSSWILNDAPIVLNLEPADLVLNRIDVVVIEINASEEIRANSVKIVKGTPGSSPVAPTLTNSQLIHQYPLAHIYVAAGVSSIIVANITNKIGTISTPFITGILQTIDSAALLSQWGSEFDVQMDNWSSIFNNWFNTNTVEWNGDFNTWFAEIQGLLGTDPAGELATAIYNHRHAEMPHIFFDGVTEYRWGLSAVDGVVTFNYEEVE